MRNSLSSTRVPAYRALLAALFCSLLCLPSVTLGALPVPADGSPVLRIQGSNTVGAKLAPLLIAGLFDQQGLSDVRIAPTGEENEQRVTGRGPGGQLVTALVAAHGSSTGFVGLKDATADIAASSRPIKESEVRALASLGDLKSSAAEQVIAIDGLAIIVNPANPLPRLDTETLARLFSGEIANWTEVGGPDQPVRIHARDDNSGTYDTFKELVLAPHGKKLASGASRYESNDQLSATVAGDLGAIGFVGYASVGRARALPIADGQSQAMAPTPAMIATEDYPLSRRLFLYAPPSGQSAWARALIEFAQSDAGQALVPRSGYIAQQVEAIRLPSQPDMPMAYRQLANEASRLTVNFRFEEGSAVLDNKAQRDLQRLAAYLAAHDKLQERAVLVASATPRPTRNALRCCRVCAP